MTTPTQNQQILNYLKPYQLEWVGIFGSWARGENGPGSDLDILIKFIKPVSLLTFVRMERELSEILSLKVDLVSEGGLKNERMRKSVLADLKLISA
ncbi:nucleotidyltransferase family protein [Spirosoma sp. KCTC 42546]|uniref:nucleotidyltransferase family protein n=1 Tax=Spirosoma sp. KCTC 42546 TaxID=2520506 RepID=UPI001157E0CE|nr:nucleotidyltransferase family protein [Spirosoma sp. KCTC 42546]QDK77636.1 nucleotidyltransferase family protein [Spirosoma sp. KCTC 42546]